MPQARLPRALSLCPALPGPPIRTRVIPACDTTPATRLSLKLEIT